MCLLSKIRMESIMPRQLTHATHSEANEDAYSIYNQYNAKNIALANMSLLFPDLLDPLVGSGSMDPFQISYLGKPALGRPKLYSTVY